MNESTDKLIRDLAEKLGTTAEHLWGVLIVQARISGITNLLVIGAWIALLVYTFKFVRHKTATMTCCDDSDKFVFTCCAWAGWCIAIFVSAAFVGCIGCSLGDILASLLNPEYWALKQIVH